MSGFENPYYFSRGVERKNLIKDNAEKIEAFKKEGLKEIIENKHYTWVDSPLEGKVQDDSNEQKSFYQSFHVLLPPGKKLGEYIEHVLAERKGDAIGVEFGGPGVEVFKGFSSGFFKKSVGITLLDSTQAAATYDEKSPHTVLTGDVLAEQTYKDLETVLGGKSVDLLFERMGRGLEFMPAEPFMLSKIIQGWYKMLRENGMMFVQTPVVFNKLLVKWAKTLEAYKDTIDFKYSDRGREDASPYCSGFRLQKLKGAPDELPFLSIEEVYNTTKSNY